MAENKMEQVAKLLGLELEEEFKIYGWDGFYKITELGLERYVKGRSWMMDSIMLIDLIKGTAKIIKIPKPILDDKEKEYLSAVIKPFRDRVIHIKKESGYSIECIKIALNPLKVMTADDIVYLPNFIKGSMYKCMRTDKAYTIDELGL